MHNRRYSFWRLTVLLLLGAALVTLSARLQADTGTCGGVTITLPFTDVQGNPFFCSIASAYFSGLTNGTTATTYTPSQPVLREQMAAFVSRTLDQSLRRGSRRAALRQWWTPTNFDAHAKSPVGTAPFLVAADGADLWVANFGSGTVTRVRASDGSILQTWTGADNPIGVLVAQGAVHITGNTNPGRLYTILPATSGSSPPVTLTTDQLGAFPQGLAFDGAAIWTANQGGSVSVVINGVTTVSAGFLAPFGILYDGSNIWITDTGDDRLKKLNADASIAASVPVGDGPQQPVFDGTNIWVPNRLSNTVTVVRVKDSAGNPLTVPFVLATLTGNGLNDPRTAAFDGQRILVTNFGGHSVSLWKATDLAPLGSFSTGVNTHPTGVCSDGINFWVTLFGFGQLLRF
ncbi:MAG TPA: S-layer homology domain-containing protein [Blastocatellia bacterium]|nr:S-layer homology domain-containing protein [Blastocatellia bacterium]